jgi:hypothetical protein
MKGLNMSDTTLSRCIICMIWPKLPSEVVDDFNKRDDEEFVTLRRKLLRWSVDNAVTLQAATPEASSIIASEITGSCCGRSPIWRAVNGPSVRGLRRSN